MTIMNTTRWTQRYLGFALAATAVLTLSGCQQKSGNTPAPIVNGDAGDPAAANMIDLPDSGTPQNEAVAAAQSAQPARAVARPRTQVASNGSSAQPTQSGETYPQQGNASQNEANNYNNVAPDNTAQPAYSAQDDTAYNNGQSALDDANQDGYGQYIDNNIPPAQQAPPPLPVYQQPYAPRPNYLWTPGYWSYAPSGYYWVPGAWVGSPYVGALWTPGWWGHYGNRYRYHRGYWGQHVGFYGGINYGFGFGGYGYQGGYWNRDRFFYNRSCNRVDARYVQNNVYERNVTVINRTYINNTRVSYYGEGGVNRRPGAQEIAARYEQHTPPMQSQMIHRQEAERDRGQFYSTNRGRPQTVAWNQPLQAQRGIQRPPALQPSQLQQIRQQVQQVQQRPAGVSQSNLVRGGFNNGQPLRPGTNNPQQIQQQQRIQATQQQQLQRNQQQLQQRNQQQVQQQQRGALDQQRVQQMQQQRQAQQTAVQQRQQQNNLQQRQQQLQQQQGQQRD